jgi:hypothetical protein
MSESRTRIFGPRKSPSYVRAFAWLPLFFSIFCLAACDRYRSSKTEKSAEVPKLNITTASQGGKSERVEAADVGELLAGHVAEHSFDFQNTSSEILRMDVSNDIQKSCGCSSVDVDRTSIAPGESAHVKVRVATDGKSGKFNESVALSWHLPSGDVRKSIYSVRGDVVSVFRLTPSNVRFSSADLQQRREIVVRVTSDIKLDWATLLAVPDNQIVTCALESPADGRNDERIIRLSVDASDIAEPTVCNVRLSSRIASFGSKPQDKDSLLRGELSILVERPAGIKVRTTIAALRLNERKSYVGDIFLEGYLEELSNKNILLFLYPSRQSERGEPVNFTSHRLNDSLLRLAIEVPETHTATNSSYFLGVKMSPQDERRIEVTLQQ